MLSTTLGLAIVIGIFWSSKQLSIPELVICAFIWIVTVFLEMASAGKKNS